MVRPLYSRFTVADGLYGAGGRALFADKSVGWYDADGQKGGGKTFAWNGAQHIICPLDYRGPAPGEEP